MSTRVRMPILAAVFLVLVPSLYAAQYHWINPGTGNWETGTNWQEGSAPGPADEAIISNGGTVNLTANTTIGILTLSSGSLTASAVWNLQVNEKLAISGGSYDSTNITLFMTALSGSAPFTLNSSVTLGDVHIQSGGNTISLGSVLTLSKGLTINSGTLDVTASNYPISVGGSWDRVGRQLLGAGRHGHLRRHRHHHGGLVASLTSTVNSGRHPDPRGGAGRRRRPLCHLRHPFHRG